MRRLTLALAALLLSTTSVAAQTHVGESTENGIHFHIAAPQGARWAMECRFRPVTYMATQYERRWINRIAQPGSGALAGRLPSNDGRCSVTKTGGSGPIGIAIVRGAEVVADGVANIGETAAVGVL